MSKHGALNHGLKNRRVLISGAGIAGIALAYWLRRYNFLPTIVERSSKIREGGYKVDIRGAAVEVIDYMGILADVLQSTVNMRGASFLDGSGRTRANMDGDLFGGRSRGDVEIMRGDLTRILYSVTRREVEYLFDNSIDDLVQGEQGVDVAFADGQTRTFDLIVGADGLHSNVRRLVFGDSSRFIRNLNHYIAIFTAPNHFNLDGWELLYATPGRTINIYGTGMSKDANVYFMFAADKLHYDHHDVAQQKRIVNDTFRSAGWQTSFLLEHLKDAPDFYFDSISQVYMESWSKQRVVLLGDAGYCASPASGQGTSLALVGAYVLAGELAGAGGDHHDGFYHYENVMRDFVKRNQDLAEANLQGMVLKSRAQIWFQIQMIRLLPYLPGKERIIGRVADAIHKAATAIQIKNYV